MWQKFFNVAALQRKTLLRIMLKQNVFSSETHKQMAQMVWLFVLTWFKLILVFNVGGSTWEIRVANLCSEYKMIWIAKFQHLELRPWVQSKRNNFELNTAGEGEHQSSPQMLNFVSPWNKVPFFCAELFTLELVAEKQLLYSIFQLFCEKLKSKEL